VPGKTPYQIAERVRLSLWEARIGSAWLDTVQASEPYKLAGNFQGGPIEMEWATGKWLRLRLQSDAADVISSFSILLGLKPAIQYQDAGKYKVWEWHVGDIAQRWKEVSGNPQYQHPRRLL